MGTLTAQEIATWQGGFDVGDKVIITDKNGIRETHQTKTYQGVIRSFMKNYIIVFDGKKEHAIEKKELYCAMGSITMKLQDSQSYDVEEL